MDFLKMLSGDTEIQKHTYNEEDFVFVANDLTSEGFQLQTGSRFEHVFEKGRDGAYLEVKAVKDGDFYLALQIMDTFGTYDEFYIPITEKECAPFCETVVELSVNDKFVGRFRYGGDDRAFYLFVTEDRIGIKKGDVIRYTVVKGEHALFTSIILMNKKPAPPVNEICDITSDNGEVRFWTRLPSRVSIIIGDESFSENQYLNNHKFTILKKYWGVRFTIEAVTEDGSILRGRGTARTKKSETVQSEKFRIQLRTNGESEGYLPAMSVLPFSEGKVFDTDGISIIDDKDNTYITDSKITSRWQDGSIRTVAINAILPNDGRSFYARNEASADTDNLHFTAMAVNEGVAVEANGKQYRFYDNMASVLPDRELYAVLYDEGGRKFVAEGGSYEISEAGKNHIIISRKNRFISDGEEHFKCITHLHFWRGILAYSLEFVFENDLMEEEFTTIKGLYLEEKGVKGQSDLVYQLDEKTALVGEEHLETRINGEFSAGEEMLIIKDFWQNYPKSFELSNSNLKIGICPFIIEPERYRCDDILLEARLFFQLKTGNYEFHRGFKKYHTIIFGKDSKKIENIPFFPPDTAAIEESRAFGHIICSLKDFPKYDEYMEENFEKYMEHREKYREYGMPNYGDSFGEREIHWTNMEYDFTYGMLIHFLRTGDSKFYDLAQSAAAHYEGVDCSHRSIRYEEDGYYFVHTPGHANNYYPYELLPKSFKKLNTHVGHLFSHGMYEYYKATGIERYKQAVLECADSLAKYYTRRYDFYTEREPGWTLLTLEAAYELTNDNYYLNACRLILERVYQKQDDRDGSIKSFVWAIDENGKKTGESLYAGKPFMLGILGTAVKYFYYLTGDERAKNSALRMARWLVEDMYNEEEQRFWYNEAFKRAGRVVKNEEVIVEILDVVLFACIMERNERYFQVAKEAFEILLESTFRRECDISKILSMKLRFAPEIMHDFAEARKLLKEKRE